MSATIREPAVKVVSKYIYTITLFAKHSTCKTVHCSTSKWSWLVRLAIPTAETNEADASGSISKDESLYPSAIKIWRVSNIFADNALSLDHDGKSRKSIFENSSGQFKLGPPDDGVNLVFGLAVVEGSWDAC